MPICVLIIIIFLVIIIIVFKKQFIKINDNCLTELLKLYFKMGFYQLNLTNQVWQCEFYILNKIIVIIFP